MKYEREKRIVWESMKIGKEYTAKELSKLCVHMSAREIGIFLGSVKKIFDGALSYRLVYFTHPFSVLRVWRKNKNIPFGAIREKLT